MKNLLLSHLDSKSGRYPVMFKKHGEMQRTVWRTKFFSFYKQNQSPYRLCWCNRPINL